MRTISSDLTFLSKLVLPTLVIGGFASSTLFMFIAPDAFEGNWDAREMRWYFLAGTLVKGAVLYWYCLRLKRVKLDGAVLLISNFRKQVAVPLHEVERVSGSILINPELIWLHFRRPTDFGTKIVFMPKLRPFPGFRHHPLVKELSELIEQVWEKGDGKIV